LKADGGGVKVVFEKNYDRNMSVLVHFGQGFSLGTGWAFLDRANMYGNFTDCVIS
jgi:hypothetical protein